VIESNDIKDSSPSGSLTVGQLKELVRKETQAALGQNGTGSPPEANKPYLTVKEAAQLARLSPSTIRLYIRRRLLPSYKVGSRVLIKRADLERFLDEHRVRVLEN